MRPILLVACMLSMLFASPATTLGATVTGVIGVVARDGVPISGAIVRLVAWPAPAILAALPTGGAVPTRVVAQTQTDVHGRFSVTPASVPSDYRDAGGFTNFEIDAEAGAVSLSWSLPLALAADATTGVTKWLSPTQIQAKAPKSPSLRFDLGSASGVTDDTDPIATWKDLSPTQVAQGSLLRVPTTATVAAKSNAQHVTQPLATGVVQPNITCVVYANGWINGVWEKFLAAYGYSGAPVTVTQVNGTSHTLGIAVSTNSGNTWSASGSMTLGESSGNGATIAGYQDQYVYNQVNYRDFVNSCDPTWHRRQPVSTYALLPSRAAYSGHSYWTTCSTYLSGTIWKNQGTNATYASGVSLGPINLSAQSGWNSSTEEAWVVNRKTAICGSTAHGWGDSPEAEAHLQN